MASWRLFTTMLGFVVLLETRSDAQERDNQNVYVSRFGNDSEHCGSPRMPCKSIAQAVRQVDWGGHIHINGTGTEQDPYTCKPLSTHVHHPGIYTNKSVIMEGFHSTPYIFCVEGFHFQKSSDGHRRFRITLSRIAFRQTPIMCEDCSHVEVINCSLQGAPTALSVRVRHSSNVRISIEASRFHKNVLCVEVLLFDYDINQSRFVKITVNDTIFLENGFYSKLPTSGVLITRASNVEKSSALVQIQVNISCYKVRGFKNKGSFVNLDLATAKTNEVYFDVILKNNNFPKIRETKGLVKSLYTSRARETRVSFVDFHCIYNRFLRCLNIRSEEAKVNIQNAFFVGQSVRNTNGAALSLESKVRASLYVTNTKFTKNKATKGGAVFVYGANGTLTLNFTNVNFTRCSAKRYGCAILVGNPKRDELQHRAGPYELHASFRKVTVASSNGEHGKCIGVYILLNNGTVTIEESTWRRNLRATNGALYVGSTGEGKTNVTISDSTFIDNSVSSGSVVKILALRETGGSATISNSLVINIEKKGKRALMISPTYAIKLTNVTVLYFSYGFQILTMSVFSFSVFIDSCNFTNNNKDIQMRLRDPASTHLMIKNTIFAGKRTPQKSYAIRFHIQPLHKNKTGKTGPDDATLAIELDNVTFESRPSSNFALFFPGSKTFKIRRSIFRNCIALYPNEWKFQKQNESAYKTATGGISILTIPDKAQQPGCVQEDDHSDTPLWIYDTHVLFEDTLFQENAGLMAGAVYITNGNVTFKRCTFQNNFGIQNAGHVYADHGTGRVEFKDCLFNKTQTKLTINNTAFKKSTFLYSETGGSIAFQNTSMFSDTTERDSHYVLDLSSAGHVDIDQSTTIRCSQGSRLLLEHTKHFVYTEKNNSFCWITLTALKYECSVCSPGSYSLRRGISYGLTVNETFQCQTCPFGATCIQTNIAAKPNFWGHHISQHPPSLLFTSCPEHYCQRPESDSSVYNSCHGKRDGTLCGTCASGYTETLFSAECQKVTECNSRWLWILVILYTTGLALYLLKKPPIMHLLSNQIFWFTRKHEESQTRESVAHVHKHSDSGYLKITFYFYQAAELLLIDPTENLLHKFPFLVVVVDTFNLQVQNVSRRIGCPFAGLTAVTKELFLSLPVVMTMADVGFIYCVHRVINLLRRKEKPTVIHYMAVVMEILLLGYDRLAETSLKLIHCVAIGSDKRLFIDGNIQCWQWWQYVLLLYIAIFVVPFMFVLYWGSSKLHKSSISARVFLGACVFPLPFLLCWSFQKMFRREEVPVQQVLNEDVVEILHGPFRPPSDNDPGTLYWESILIGRRFILLTLNAFISNSMLRMVCISVACVLMALHHFSKRPYRDPLANKVETLSLITLVIMTITNLTNATLVTFGVSSEGPNQPYFESFEWFEVCAMAFVPALLSVLVVFAILSQLVRFLMVVVKQVLRTDEQRRPLLPAAAPNYGAQMKK